MMTVVDSISSLQTWALPEQQLAQRQQQVWVQLALNLGLAAPGLQESIHLVPPCIRTQRRAGMVPVLRWLRAGGGQLHPGQLRIRMNVNLRGPRRQNGQLLRGEAGDVRNPCQGTEVWKNLEGQQGLSVAGAQGSGEGEPRGGKYNKGPIPSSKGPGHYLGSEGIFEGINSGLSTWR